MKVSRSILVILVTIFVMSCNKGKLNLKPSNSLRVPETLQDLQGLLDNTSVMTLVYPYLNELGADDYYLTLTQWNTLSNLSKNAYIWEKDFYVNIPANQSISDWDFSYRRIFYANVVLEDLEKLSNKSTDEFSATKGFALFHRAINYWVLAQLFCKPYSLNTATSDLGLPLRLKTDVLTPVGRSTIQDTYDLIIQDLKESLSLLPTTVVQPTRPNKAAANALLSRVYLSMQNYDSALQYATASLNLNSTLLDFNTLSTTASFPIKQYNSETLFYASEVSNAKSGFSANYNFDTSLYKSYSNDDLRKSIFFNSATNRFKGNYTGGTAIFCGVATDEVYLTRAECYARKGNIQNALDDLNTLIKSRWKNNGSFAPYSASSTDQVLSIIVAERKKELPFRGLRWTDLRRLNLANANITLTRILSGQSYTLPPNDPRYVYPIPLSEIAYNPIQQNER